MRAEPIGPLWRRILSGLLLVLFCLAAPLALVTGWARLVAVDTDAYVQTVRALAQDSRVRDAVAQAVTMRVETALAGENPTATEALQARQATEGLGEATRAVLTSDPFQDAWAAANRNAHRLLVAGLAAGRGQPVTLDFSPLLPRVADEVAARGIDLPPDVTLDASDLRLELLDAATADRIRLALGRLTLTFWTAVIAAAVALVLTVVVAPDRLAALARVGFGLAVAMAAAIALMLVAQTWAASVAGAGGRVVVAVIVEAISQRLRVAAVGLALAGLLLAGICGGLHALRGSTARRMPIVAEEPDPLTPAAR
jgi:hypothetical protein